MISLSTIIITLSPFPSFAKQHKPDNTNALFNYNTHKFTNSGFPKRGGFVAHKKHTFVAVHDASDQVETSRMIPLLDVVVVRKKRAFWERSWTHWDVVKLAVVSGVHLLSLLAPFYFSWAAFWAFPWIELNIIWENFKKTYELIG